MALLSVNQEGPTVGNTEWAAIGHGELETGFCVVEDAAKVQCGAGELEIREVNLPPQHHLILLRMAMVAELQHVLNHTGETVLSIHGVETHPYLFLTSDCQDQTLQKEKNY